MKLEKTANRISEFILGHYKSVLIVMFVLFALLIPAIPSLINNVEPSLEKVLPQDTEVVKLMNDMRAQYGADMMYLIVEDEGVNDLRLSLAITYIDLLSQKLATDDYVLDVFSIATIVKEHNKGVIPSSDEEIKKILRNDPRTSLYLADTFDFTYIQITSDTGAEAEVIKKVVQNIESDVASLEAYNPGVKLSLTGFNAIDKATFEVIISDFTFITGFSFLFILILLLFYFKGSIRKVLYTVSVIMISLIFTLGIAGYLGLTLTVVSMVAAAMIMALGIDYGIHTAHKFFELRKEGHNPRESIILMQEELFRAMLGSSLTTSAGFLALLFGVIPAMKTLGIILGIGIIMTLIVTVIFVPAIIYAYEKNKV
jgi:predicted RND superfamily exporter protein